MSAEEPVDRLLDQWEKLRERGQTISIGELCQDTPDLADEVREQIEAIEEIEDLLDVNNQTVTFGDSSKENSETIDLPEIPGFLILECIGHGGMGVVYKAWHAKLDRIVALKMLLGRYLPEDLQRFEREVQTQAQFDHPNIVKIHHADKRQGQLYFTMELAEGGSLSQRLKRGPLPAREAAEIIQTLAAALEHAHRTTVHRDIKPGNILLMRDGTPKIADFGLAKRLDDGASLTPGTAVFGMPAYMSPEQAAGKGKDVGAAADIYSLGATLYALLTGKAPFQGDTKIDIITKVVSEEPIAPRQWKSDIPRNLEAICLKCLEKKTAQRYASAQALADDLGCYMRGEPTQARPLTRLQKSVRWLRRRPALFAAIAIAVAAVITAFLIPPFFNSNRSIRALEASIYEGKETVILGAESYPVWHEWGLNDGVILKQKPGNGITVQSKKFCQLKLLPNLDLKKFRITAEIMHQEGEINSEVGLFFGARQFATAAGSVDVFWDVRFNDVRRIRNGSGNSLSFQLHVRQNGKPVSFKNLNVRGRPRLPFPARFGGSLFVFEPRQKLGDKRWRRLKMEVTPSVVTTYFDGQKGQMQVGELRQKNAKRFSAYWQALGFSIKNLDGSGSVGLYLDDSVVSLKNLTLKRL